MKRKDFKGIKNNGRNVNNEIQITKCENLGGIKSNSLKNEKRNRIFIKVLGETKIGTD